MFDHPLHPRRCVAHLSSRPSYVELVVDAPPSAARGIVLGWRAMVHTRSSHASGPVRVDVPGGSLALDRDRPASSLPPGIGPWATVGGTLRLLPWGRMAVELELEPWDGVRSVLGLRPVGVGWWRPDGERYGAVAVPAVRALADRIEVRVTDGRRRGQRRAPDPDGVVASGRRTEPPPHVDRGATWTPYGRPDSTIEDP